MQKMAAPRGTAKSREETSKQGFWCKSAAPICVYLMRRITFRLEALRSRLRAQFRAEGRNVVARTAPCGYGASARCRRS